MSRILLVAGPDPGHLHPVLGVGVALAARGHEVVVATGENRREVARAAGLTHVPLPLLRAIGPDDDFGARLWERAGQMAPALVETLEVVPDLLVADTLTTAGAFVAELLDVPWIEVVPHHLRDPDPALPPIGLGRQPARSMLRRASDALLRHQQGRSIDQGRVMRDRVRRELGLVGVCSPAARLVCSLPALEYPRSRWPADTHLVGALAWEPPGPSELLVPGGGAPLVLVTESTASSLTTSLGEYALRGLRHTGVRLVVTTTAPLTPWPNDCVVGAAPHGPLLDRAAVAVGPGGGGFVTKALTRGVPLVVVPAAGDQRETAARVVWAGVGRSLVRPGPAGLRHAVRRVLDDPEMGRRASEVGRDAAGRGPKMAADVIESVLNGRPLVAHGPERDAR